MDSNEKRSARESGISRGTIIIVAILAVAAIAGVLYFLSISNRLVSIGNRTGNPMLNLQESSTLSFVAWLVIGLIGSKVLNKTGRGLFRDCLIGIVGAFVSGFLANLLGKPGGPGLDLYSL